jgi:hypothetical protein
MEAIETAHHTERVVDRPQGVSDRQVRLARTGVDRASSTRRRRGPVALWITPRSHPPHQHLYLIGRGPIPHHLQEPQHTKPAQQIKAVAPARQDAHVAQRQVTQKHARRLELATFAVEHHVRRMIQISGDDLTDPGRIDTPLHQPAVPSPTPHQVPSLNERPNSEALVQLTGR